MSTIEAVSIGLGIVGTLTGIGGLVYAHFAKGTADRANELASDSNGIATGAAAAAQRSADAAEQAVALAMDRLAAQLVITKVSRHMATDLICDFHNGGGSVAENLRVITITAADGTGYPIEQLVTSVPPGETVTQELTLPVGLPSGPLAFSLEVSYKDAVQDHVAALPWKVQGSV